MADAKALRTTRLILIPTVITLAVTILRVVGTQTLAYAVG